MITWAKVILLLLQIVDAFMKKAQEDAAIQKADEDAIARVTVQILKRTRYAQKIDDVVGGLSDADIEQRLRPHFRQ